MPANCVLVSARGIVQAAVTNQKCVLGFERQGQVVLPRTEACDVVKVNVDLKVDQVTEFYVASSDQWVATKCRLGSIGAA